MSGAGPSTAATKLPPAGSSAATTSSSGVRVTFELPCEAVEQLKKLLESRASSSPHLEKNPDKRKHPSSQQPQSGAATTFPSSSSTPSSSGSLNSSGTHPLGELGITSLQIKGCPVYHFEVPERVSKERKSPKKPVSSFVYPSDSLKKVTSNGPTALGAVGASGGSLSPLLVNLLKQDDEASRGNKKLVLGKSRKGGASLKSDATSHLHLPQHQHHHHNSNSIPSKSTADYMSAQQIHRNLLQFSSVLRQQQQQLQKQHHLAGHRERNHHVVHGASESESEKSLRLKLRLPLDSASSAASSSSSQISASTSSATSFNSTSAHGTDSPDRKIPKLILSVKDKTIVKKNQVHGDAGGSGLKGVTITQKMVSNDNVSRKASASGESKDVRENGGNMVMESKKLNVTQVSSSSSASTGASRKSVLTSVPPSESPNTKTTATASSASASSTSSASVALASAASVTSSSSAPSSSTNSNASSTSPSTSLPSSAPISLSSSLNAPSSSTSQVATSSSKMVPVKLVTVSGEGNMRLVRVSKVKTESSSTSDGSGNSRTTVIIKRGSESAGLDADPDDNNGDGGDHEPPVNKIRKVMLPTTALDESTSSTKRNNTQEHQVLAAKKSSPGATVASGGSALSAVKAMKLPASTEIFSIGEIKNIPYQLTCTAVENNVDKFHEGATSGDTTEGNITEAPNSKPLNTNQVASDMIVDSKEKESNNLNRKNANVKRRPIPNVTKTLELPSVTASSGYNVKGIKRMASRRMKQPVADVLSNGEKSS